MKWVEIRIGPQQENAAKTDLLEADAALVHGFLCASFAVQSSFGASPLGLPRPRRVSVADQSAPARFEEEGAKVVGSLVGLTR